MKSTKNNRRFQHQPNSTFTSLWKENFEFIKLETARVWKALSSPTLVSKRIRVEWLYVLTTSQAWGSNSLELELRIFKDIIFKFISGRLGKRRKDNGWELGRVWCWRKVIQSFRFYSSISVLMFFNFIEDARRFNSRRVGIEKWHNSNWRSTTSSWIRKIAIVFQDSLCLGFNYLIVREKSLEFEGLRGRGTWEFGCMHCIGHETEVGVAWWRRRRRWG